MDTLKSSSIPKFTLQSLFPLKNGQPHMATLRLYYSFCLILFITLIPVASNANEPSTLFNKINLYAEMSSAAYLNEQEARTKIEALGYQLEQFNQTAGAEVGYFIATNKTLKHQIIAVRGTANVANAIVDISLKLLPDKQTKITLHQGFSQATEAIYNAIKNSLNKDYRTSITGHSLGGAVAVILAMYLDINQHPLDTIITFGQPKVTNLRGAQRFSGLNIIRVVTPQDLVPLVPPLDMMDIRNLDIYWHLGEEVILLDGADYAVLKGVKSIMRATKIVNRQMGKENLEHHKMSRYLSLIKDKLNRANLVPYESRINLFKLFGGN